jgi:hypothetical protein
MNAFGEFVTEIFTLILSRKDGGVEPDVACIYVGRCPSSRPYSLSEALKNHLARVSGYMQRQTDMHLSNIS